VVVAWLTLHEQGLQMALLLFYHQVEVAVEVTEGEVVEQRVGLA